MHYLQKLMLLLLLWLGQNISAQEHPFLSRFVAEEGDAAVTLEWTMVGGSTCFGIQVLRSFDGVTFEQVGRIEGLCGSIVDSVSYRFVDEHPVQFTQHYYRLELGVNGFSSIQSFYFDQLIEEDTRVLYNLQTAEIVIYSKIELGQKVQLTLFDNSGVEVFAETIAEGRRISMQSGLVGYGVYVYQIQYNEKKVTGKLVYFNSN